MRPIRIQRQRVKGWRMPPNTFYVGRGSRWGNPFKVGEAAEGINTDPGGLTFYDGHSVKHIVTSAQEAVHLYGKLMLPYEHKPPRNTMADFLLSNALLEEMIRDLRGKNLACWCKIGEPCHADWLLGVVNDGYGNEDARGKAISRRCSCAGVHNQE